MAPRTMSDDDRAFYHGVALALATLIRSYDQPSMAVDILKSNGISIEDLCDAKVDAFDLRPLRKAWREETGERRG